MVAGGQRRTGSREAHMRGAASGRGYAILYADARAAAGAPRPRRCVLKGSLTVMRPVIGLATRSSGDADPTAPPRFYNNQSYAQAIAAYGGAPLLVPSLVNPEALDTLYGLLDGLLLPGGPDIDPAFYGEQRHASVEVDDALDGAEAYLLRRALADDLPILGICRGVQVLNVIAGGTLYQDLPTQWPAAVAHSVYEHGRAHTPHTLTVLPGTDLAHIVGPGASQPIPVNTLHHQAVRDVAPGFRVNAHADDGLIEGIESTTKTFTLGVQCHPEELYNGAPTWGALFSAFVAAAERRASARRGTPMGSAR